MSKHNKSLNKNIHISRTGLGNSVLPMAAIGAIAGVALIAVAVFLVYIPSISGGFIWDDFDFVTDNPLIRATNGLYRYWFTTESIDYWPVTNTTFWIEWRLWEMNPVGYHVTNYILHIIGALLIWIVLRKLSIPGAFLAAVIFAVHPVNVESVAWISQRKNLLAMLFLLLSILWYLKFLTRAHLRFAAKQISNPQSLIPNFWYWMSLGAFVLAMLSKGSVAVLPLLLLGIVWWLRPLTKRDLFRIAPFFLVAVALAAVNVWFQRHGMGFEIRNAGFVERLLGAGGVVWFYLYKAFLPFDLAFVYPLWHIEPGNPLWWLPLLAALAVTATFWKYRWTWSRPLLFAWGFFCVALMPVMGFADVYFMKYSLVADHYQHIALIGAVALASALWSIWHQRERGAICKAAVGAAVAAVCVLMFLTWRQSGLYRDEIVLYQDTLKKNPNCWMAHNNLGKALSIVGRLEEAIGQLQQTLQLNPKDAGAYCNLGNAMFLANRPQEAIKYCRHALLLNPDHPEAHYTLGNALVKTGLVQDGIEQFEQAVRLKPNYADAYVNLGVVLAQTGQPGEAIKNYEQALLLRPDNIEAQINLGNALIQAGRPQDAIKYCRQALRQKSDNPKAYYNLANALAQTGRPGDAIEQYEQALRLKPDYAEAHFNLGLVLIQSGRHREAIEHFRRLTQLSPDNFRAYKNLALSYAKMGESNEAVSAAQKALELARTQRQTEQARQIEDWLNAYRAGVSK